MLWESRRTACEAGKKGTKAIPGDCGRLVAMATGSTGAEMNERRESESQKPWVAVLGAGTMGRGIAQAFAQSGYEVSMFDTVAAALDGAGGQIAKMLDRAVEKGKLTATDSSATKARLHPVRILSDLPRCALIVEAAPEKVELKIDVLSE